MWFSALLSKAFFFFKSMACYWLKFKVDVCLLKISLFLIAQMFQKFLRKADRFDYWLIDLQAWYKKLESGGETGVIEENQSSTHVEPTLLVKMSIFTLSAQLAVMTAELICRNHCCSPRSCFYVLCMFLYNHTGCFALRPFVTSFIYLANLMGTQTRLFTLYVSYSRRKYHWV